MAQKGTRSNYRATRIFKSPILNKKPFLVLAEYMPRRHVFWAESLVLWAELCQERN